MAAEVGVSPATLSILWDKFREFHDLGDVTLRDVDLVHYGDFYAPTLLFRIPEGW